MPATVQVRVHSRADVQSARWAARRIAEQAGLDREHSAEWEIVATELATNLVRHAGGGSICLQRCDSPRDCLVMQCDDSGPGIASVTEAMREGFSTRGGLGGGLSAIEQFSDEMEVQTSPGGTSITVRRWLT